MDTEEIFIDLNELTSTRKNLGEGGFGKVFIVRNKTTNEEYAAKELDASSYFLPQAQKLLLREAINLSRLHHVAIVQFKGFSFISFFDPKKWQPTIFTEYVENKSLRKILYDENHSLAPSDWNTTKKFINILGISSAMKYLHKNHLVHRDLKPENILIDSEYYPKLCDFGFSRDIQEKMTNNIGTNDYMAPEIFIGEQYDEKVDVYSFAILTYEIITGLQPYPDLKEFNVVSINKIINGSLRPKFPEFTNENMKNLIMKCWSSDPNERPSFEEIFKELSQNFESYQDDLDKDEICCYLDLLEDNHPKDFVENPPAHSIEDDYYKEIAKFYLSRGEKNNMSILYYACLNDNLNLVRFLLSMKEVDVNEVYNIQYNCFLNNDILYFIIFMKLDYQFFFFCIYQAPLHIVCQKENVEIAKLLLSNEKIDVNIISI